VGDEIEIRMWEDKSRNDEKVVFFEARTTKNDEIVVDMGVASLSQGQKSLGRGSLNAKL
jgi:ABC-type sulfate transport system substrate-binding protein